LTPAIAPRLNLTPRNQTDLERIGLGAVAGADSVTVGAHQLTFGYFLQDCFSWCLLTNHLTYVSHLGKLRQVIEFHTDRIKHSTTVSAWGTLQL